MKPESTVPIYNADQLPVSRISIYFKKLLSTLHVLTKKNKKIKCLKQLASFDEKIMQNTLCLQINIDFEKLGVQINLPLANLAF